MKVFIKREDFSMDCCELCLGENMLEFNGTEKSFSLPYSQVGDFVITQDSNGKAYFTTVCAGRMYEGRIVDQHKIEPFALGLKAKLRGVVQIDIRKG